jgi:hypothetical protein
MKAALIQLILKSLGKILSISGLTISSVLEKIFKKKKMVKKEPTKKVPVASRIGADTQIVFTLKTFLATMGTILGLFVGFYTLVIVPKFNDSAKTQKEMFDEQKAQNQIFYTKFDNINTSLGTLNGTIEALNKEKINQQAIPNTGGSFSSVNTRNTGGNSNIPGNSTASNSGH